MPRHDTPTLNRPSPNPAPSAQRPPLRPLALAALTIGTLFGPMTYAPAALAQGAVAARSYNVPAGPLGTALTAFAAQAGVVLSFDPQLAAGRHSAGLSGPYAVDEGFARLLEGSGLHAAAAGDGRYTVRARPQPAGADAAPEATLGTVMVTGEKIERRLQDTVSSVAVATAQDIAAHADRNLNDVMMRTPGVYISSGNELWGIRGVPVSGFDDQGPGTLNGAVSVTVDGAAQAHRVLTMNPLSMWDVEQVEIYRGAQSTVQGRNALAGAVVVQTRNPTYQPELASQISVGSDGQRGAAVVAGGALVPGVVAGRLAVDYQQQDGYIRNETLGEDADRRRSLNARGKLLIHPSDRMEVLLTVAHTDQRTGDNAVAKRADGRPDYYALFYNTDAHDEIRQDAVTARVDYFLDDAWTLTSITSQTRTRYDSLLDFDQGPTSLMEVVRRHDGNFLNQELRLGYRSDTLRGHVGAYWGRSRYEQDDRLDFSGAPFGRIVADTTIVNRALFGELEWDMNARWQLIAGLRHDHERNSTRFEQDDFSAPGRDSLSSDALLPKLGVVYRLSADDMLSAQVQRGYRSGGVNVRAGAAHVAYDPEFTTTYEFGYRGAFLDKRMRAAANVYHTDWRDQQVSIDDGSGFLQVANAGRSRMQGLEVSAEFDATRALRLHAAASYGRTRYDDFVTGAGDDYSGKAFLFAPRYKLTVGGNFRVTEQLNIGGDVVHQPESPSAYITNASGQVVDTRRSDAVTLVNLNLGYRISKSVQVSAYVKNLFDERYITNNQSGPVLDVGAPRTLGVSLRADL
ncbi:TonB-dependent receptor domain-containing protein [Azoarcus olearius]|uniref:Ferric-citrate TonB-dependent receptor n=1 Tax=Azoarcus sp. (strain BH72) TaxID=418699 RepID=A1K837_AZOSB|nr:TonB-dependent receptor [Azoarcus olearius]CAL94992.1 putative ferric-citrate TonB-dependent receptor [Azoarcus olearius]